MLSGDEFLEDILRHYIPDRETPAERHERYLRERELKGRTTGGGSTPAPTRRPSTSSSVTRAPAKPLPKKTPVDPAVKRAATEKRIEEMQARLDKLRELLRKLVDQAQERSGVEQPEKEAKTEPTKSSSSDKLTEAEKAEKAKATEEWRKKNPDKVLDQKAKRLETQIKNVEDKIKEMRKKLAESPAPRPTKTPGSDKVGYNPLPRR